MCLRVWLHGVSKVPGPVWSMHESKVESNEVSGTTHFVAAREPSGAAPVLGQRL